MKRYFKAISVLAFGGLLASNGNAFARHSVVIGNIAVNDSVKLNKAAVLKLATSAYIYGLPAVFTDFTRQASGAPNNIYAHGHKFPDHTSRLVVAPNNDTNTPARF